VRLVPFFSRLATETFAPGQYLAKLSGLGGDAGVGLIEVNDVP